MKMWSVVDQKVNEVVIGNTICGLLPSQSQEASMIFRVLFQQTNKTNKQAHKKTLSPSA